MNMQFLNHCELPPTFGSSKKASLSHPAIHIETYNWTLAENQLLYSALYFAEKYGISLSHQFNPKLTHAVVLVHINGVRCLLDYTDQVSFFDSPANYDLYFKRSLLQADYKDNVHPLGLMVTFSYKPLKILALFGARGCMQLLKTAGRAELIRALDITRRLTNQSHHAMDIRLLPKQTSDSGGRVLYLSRLWNPANNSQPEEKERRRLQTERRIAICRTIRQHFPNSFAGLAADAYSQQVAPDLLLEDSKVSRWAFFKELLRADICIADDGLGDTPGWKIGEYMLCGKAVVTSSIRTVVPGLLSGTHYVSMNHADVAGSVHSAVEQLLCDRQYKGMAEQSLQWSRDFLWPDRYFQRIVDLATGVIQ